MEFTVNQIAELVNGEVEGNGDVRISTLAKIEEGVPGALSFLANPKYTHYIYTTGSSAVLVRRDFVPEHPVAATLIHVDDPYATVAHLLTIVNQMINPPKRGVEQPVFIAPGVELPDDCYVGAFAYIGAGVHIGAGAQIYPGTYVGEGVVIGDNVTLYPGVKIYHGCRIGNRCIIHSGAVIGADGFGFAPVDGHYTKIPQIGNVVIGDDVEIGANTTVDRATMGSTVIEPGVKLDNLIQIAHNVHVGADTVMASQAGVAGSTTVGTHCMIGGQVGIAGHIRIGDNVDIAAQSGVHKNVKDNSRIFGSPAEDFREYVRKASALRKLPDLIERVEKIENNCQQTNNQSQA